LADQHVTLPPGNRAAITKSRRIATSLAGCMTLIRSRNEHTERGASLAQSLQELVASQEVGLGPISTFAPEKPSTMPPLPSPLDTFNAGTDWTAPPPIPLRMRWVLAAPALFVGLGLLVGMLVALLLGNSQGVGLMAAGASGVLWVLAAIGFWRGQSGLAFAGMICALAAGISSNVLLSL
jgi:hypothetical protein